MTKTELARLAAAVSVLRPDWPEPSLRSFLERHLAHRPPLDVGVALAWVALDPDTQTPARVLEAGPWWQAATTRDVPRSANTCAEHPHSGLRVDPRSGVQTCAGCWADMHANARPVEFRRRPPSPEDRAAIVGALSGVTPRDSVTPCEVQR